MKFRVWTRSDQIDNYIANNLSLIGINDVFIGVESGDINCLQAFQKGTKPQQNIEATKILKKFGIKVYAQFVFGAPGETEESLENSINHAKELLSIGNVETIAATVFLPIPGSKSWEMVKQKTSMLNSDLFDYKKLQTVWIKEFTNVRIETIKQFLKKIENLPSKMHVIRSEI